MGKKVVRKGGEFERDGWIEIDVPKHMERVFKNLFESIVNDWAELNRNHHKNRPEKIVSEDKGDLKGWKIVKNNKVEKYYEQTRRKKSDQD